MTDQQIILLLNVILWLFFSVRLVAALRQGRLRRTRSLQAWMIIVACYLVAALTVESLGDRVDALFGGQPVAMLLRCLMVLLTAHFFFTGLNWVPYTRTPADGLFRLTSPLVIAACIAAYIGGTSAWSLTTDQTEHLVFVIRDTAMVVWIPLVFFPKLHILLAREQNRAMQIHRLLNLGFLVAAWFQFAAGVGFSGAYLIDHASVGFFEEANRLTTYVVLLFILAQLFPARWLMPLLFPVRAWILLRLTRLERHMRVRSYTKRREIMLQGSLWQGDDFDLLIYGKLITILDMRDLLDASATSVRRQIADILNEDPPHDTLARRLAGIRL
jgi:hypothetical protein